MIPRDAKLQKEVTFEKRLKRVRDIMTFEIVDQMKVKKGQRYINCLINLLSTIVFKRIALSFSTGKAVVPNCLCPSLKETAGH